MRATTVLFSIATALSAAAQIPLPMYELGPNGTLLVGHNIESFEALEHSLRTVTAVDRNGVRMQEVERLTRYNPPHDSTQWATRLAARLEEPVRPGALYFPGEVHGLQLFEPEERTVYFWGGDTLDPMLLSGGRDLRYIWKADPTGECHLAIQELNDHHVPHEVTSYHIRRSACMAWQRDSVAVVHCKPDMAFENKEPAIVFVLVNGEAVHVWREPAYADMSPTTHHYLLATLVQGKETALLFTTGEMLVYRNHDWNLRVQAARVPEVSMIARE